MFMQRIILKHLRIIHINRTCSKRSYHNMNRPRNRQPRQYNNNPRPGPRGPPQNAISNVPTIQHVIQGASVAIVLKADQPTGKETQGIVKDLLTRGNHPRGIKVRLQDGQIGRVQRMSNGSSSSNTTARPISESTGAQKPDDRQSKLSKETGACDEPPSRTLADFMPDIGDAGHPGSFSREVVRSSTQTVKCPICGDFEGDEAAVSHHVDDHLG